MEFTTQFYLNQFTDQEVLVLKVVMLKIDPIILGTLTIHWSHIRAILIVYDQWSQRFLMPFC